MSKVKEWKNIKFLVNNLEIEARYNQDTIEKIFFPLLEKWSKMYKEKQERIIIFLAAPPAVGKTTLSQFLENLSKENKQFEKIQGVGLDGFHYPNKYLDNHTIEKNGETILLRSIKGAPETFNYKAVEEKLIKIKNENIMWPVYSRKLHDIEEDKIKIEKNIILIEGNWLLLDEDNWKNLKKYSDYSIMITAEKELLKDRLITRKIMGGKSQKEAEEFYEKSDGKNIERVLNNIVKHDLTLEMESDGDYTIKNKI